MPINGQPSFVHGLPPTPDFDSTAEDAAHQITDERKLAVLMMPADPRRFEEDFDRLLRIIAPYDCEVMRFLRVIRTSLSVTALGNRLVQDHILHTLDRFIVVELREEPWLANNAKSMYDCERL
jgi:hypothetical protein